MRELPALLTCLILTSCRTMGEASTLCEHWATDDGSGLSVLWEPSPLEMNVIEKYIGQNRTYECAEANPSGNRTVVLRGIGKVDREFFALNFKMENGELLFLDEEIFVRLAH